MSNEVVVLDPPSDRSRPGLLVSLRRHALTIALALVGGAVVGFLGSLTLPTEYTAESQVYLGADALFTPLDQGGGDPVRFTADQAELVVTSDVLQRAGEAVDPAVPVDELRRDVLATPSADTSRLTVTVVRPEAEQARAIADAVVQSYRETSRARVEQFAEAGIEAVADATQKEQIRLRAAAYGDGVAAVEPASLPSSPSAPLPTQNAVILGLVAALLAIGVVLVRDQRKAGRASVADLDLLIGAPLLSRYPAATSSTSDEIISTEANSPQLHAAHDVLMAIDLALEGRESSSVLFLSWQRALTSTSLVVAVAVSAARAGREVVVIDGGLKQRGVSAMTDVDPGHGLEALADPATPVRAALRTWKIADTELGVVPIDGWAPAPTGAAARPQVLRSAVERLRDRSSLVLVDGPPLTERSLGLALGRGVDGVVLVIDEQTSVDDAHEMGRRIGLAGVGVLGYVLVGNTARGKVSWSPQRREEGPLSLGATEGSHRV
ncbi:MAG: hypothetical protein OJJ54_03815 [Pseudonocardia sp.]|nr:hypothetical protein [Pseudonocardia sp.]